jgi:hypothetical protein
MTSLRLAADSSRGCAVLAMAAEANADAIVIKNGQHGDASTRPRWKKAAIVLPGSRNLLSRTICPLVLATMQ